jgi:hypothetical protein
MKAPNVGPSHTFLYQVPHRLIFTLSSGQKNGCKLTYIWGPFGLFVHWTRWHLMKKIWFNSKACQMNAWVQGCALSCHSSGQKSLPFVHWTKFSCQKRVVSSQNWGISKFCSKKLCSKTTTCFLWNKSYIHNIYIYIFILFFSFFAFWYFGCWSRRLLGTRVIWLEPKLIQFGKKKPKLKLLL